MQSLMHWARACSDAGVACEPSQPLRLLQLKVGDLGQVGNVQYHLVDYPRADGPRATSGTPQFSSPAYQRTFFSLVAGKFGTAAC